MYSRMKPCLSSILCDIFYWDSTAYAIYNKVARENWYALPVELCLSMWTDPAQLVVERHSSISKVLWNLIKCLVVGSTARLIIFHSIWKISISIIILPICMIMPSSSSKTVYRYKPVSALIHFYSGLPLFLLDFRL